MKAPKKKNTWQDNRYFLKWLVFIAAYLIIGGIAAFALIYLTMGIINGGEVFGTIWIVGMIPLMTLISVPITIIIYRQISRNLLPLVSGMDRVAGGELNTYIPTAEAKDFKKVYENFNKMVSEIQSVEALRTTMLDNLSHELKTPIASINGFSKILLEKEHTPEKQKQYLGIIAAESDRLDKMVKNILLLGKLDAQEIVTHKESVSLNGQLRDCIIALEHDWADKDINMEAVLPEVAFSGDGELMKSIWFNLLSNAIKFTPRGGDITVTLTTDEKHVFVAVRDSGIGMSEETKKHIFDRRFQADTKQKSAGQGLGLAIVQRAVRLCGGKISVESRESEGSTFTVELPKGV